MHEKSLDFYLPKDWISIPVFYKHASILFIYLSVYATLLTIQIIIIFLIIFGLKSVHIYSNSIFIPAI